MDHAAAPESIACRLREGFERIALVLRADQWSAAGGAGLNPAQAQVLSLLTSRQPGLRAREIAAHLGVSPASVADTLAALQRKGLIARTTDPADARAVLVRVSDAGRRLGAAVGEAASQVGAALAALDGAQQADLLRAQITIIRALQQAGAIPVQRMCVTCRHFRPHAHRGTGQPHHCAFVDAAFGDRDLRLDCGEHEPAEPSHQAATWRAFANDGPAPLQAEP